MRMSIIDGGITVRVGGINRWLWLLIAAVEFVEPQAFECVVLHGGECRSLVETTKEDICSSPRSNVEHLLCCIKSIWKREEW